MGIKNYLSPLSWWVEFTGKNFSDHPPVAPVAVGFTGWERLELQWPVDPALPVPKVPNSMMCVEFFPPQKKIRRDYKKGGMTWCFL